MSTNHEPTKGFRGDSTNTLRLIEPSSTSLGDHGIIDRQFVNP